MLVVEEFDDGHPRVAIVDIVAETRGINDSETDSCQGQRRVRFCYVQDLPLKNFSSSSALVISISTVLSTCFACLRL